MSTNIIEIQNLEMVIAGRRILKVDSLQIARGEKVAILGRNGAGKSTLLRCLNGFVKPRPH
jgi:ABC-type cobalamin/Fe3+-siderophores transport system ATPase subunit